MNQVINKDDAYILDQIGKKLYDLSEFFTFTSPFISASTDSFTDFFDFINGFDKDCWRKFG